jgi:hypothetical protein
LNDLQSIDVSITIAAPRYLELNRLVGYRDILENLILHAGFPIGGVPGVSPQSRAFVCDLLTSPEKFEAGIGDVDILMTIEIEVENIGRHVCDCQRQRATGVGVEIAAVHRITAAPAPAAIYARNRETYARAGIALIGPCQVG